MEQWTAQTAALISKHCKDFDTNTYKGQWDSYVPSLGGIFAECFGKTDKVTTVSEFQRRCEYVQGLMAIWGFDYYNGSTYWRWGQGTGTKAAADAFRTSGKGRCASGDIKKLCTDKTIVTTNCNYGVDTLMKSCGYSTWSCDYDKMLAAGAKKVTDKSKLQVGDFVHFFSGSVKKANWRHIAVVYAIDKDGIWLADFGQRFIKNKKPLHLFPAEYSGYGSNWFGVRFLNLTDDSEVIPMLNGIDIASYQAGIDFGKVPADFVIIKATEGTGYVNPDCNRAYANAKQNGKLLGLYHYANGINAVLEADHFLESIKNYIGTAILVLDWESGGNGAFGKTDVSWCKTWLDRVYQKTGVRPLIYMSQSVTNARDWSAIAKDYGLWVAQYVVESRSGYKQDYAHGTTGAWKYPAIFQYTSGGYLSGWSARLDLDVAYMDKAAWNKYASAKKEEQKEVIPVPRTIRRGSTGKAVRVLQEILGGLKVDGKYGAKTEAAVKAYQKKKGLTVDGYVGPKTWRSLLETLA